MPFLAAIPAAMGLAAPAAEAIGGVGSGALTGALAGGGAGAAGTGLLAPAAAGLSLADIGAIGKTAGGLAGSAAQLAQHDKPQMMDSNVGHPGRVSFASPQPGPIGSELPTQPLTAALGGSSLPSNVSAGSYQLPRNYGLYQGAQNLDLLNALQGGK